MIKEKMRRKLGFTLAETLITIVLLLLATGIVAAGIPVAVNAYKKVTQAANAQVLLSTTLTELRDKLAFSEDIAVTGTAVAFRNENGRSYVLYNQNKDGIYMQDVTEDTSADIDSRLLVSDEAATRELYAKYKSVDYDASNPGLITFQEIKVYRKTDDHELAYVDKYSIELMNNE